MRRPSMLRAALVWAAPILAACGAGEAEPPAPAPAAAAAADPSADPSANPAAMCAEHGVLESLCTLCNPALVPVFVARGDFCEEHELPESICPVCHPERGGRPGSPVALDTAPADGTRVRLSSAELAERIGIRTEPARRAPGVREIVATARVVYDPARLARVNPRAPGVIRAITADIGDHVEPGGDLVTISSGEVGARSTRVSAARSRLEIAEANLERREQLAGVVSERDRLAARRERDEARAELAEMRASLDMVGGARGSNYTLEAPIEGIVTRRAGTIGAFVDSDAVLFEIVDPSRVWVELEVPEDEVASVAPGQPVVITMDALPERRFEGALHYLAPEIDPRTRTALGRVPLDNPDGALRAHMFGHGRVQVPQSGDAVLVPRDAVQRARGASIVFARVADELYEVRRVEVIERAGDAEDVEVRGRVEPGEQVVVDGAFLLRTETISDSIGAGCCEAPEPPG